MLRKILKKILSEQQKNFLRKLRSQIYNSIFPNFTQQKLEKLAQKHRFAILIFDHQLGGGADFYLYEKLDTLFSETNTTPKNVKSIKSLFYNPVGEKLPSIAFVVFFKNDMYLLKILSKNTNTVTLKLKNLDAVRAFFNYFEVLEIFVNELVTFKYLSEVSALICEMTRLQKVPVSIPIHDYFPLCPRRHLLDEDDQYCALEKDLQACNACALKLGGGGDDIEFKCISDFRANFERLFDVAREIIIFSKSSQKLLCKIFEIPQEKLKFAPHQLNYFKAFQGKYQVGILGNLVAHKGLKEVFQLADLCALQPFEFVVFGNIFPTQTRIPKNIRILGGYNRQDLPRLVRAEKIDIFLMPSICPETFSYTTHEVIALGLPLICFPLGAQADITADYALGRIAKNISAQALHDELLDFFHG